MIRSGTASITFTLTSVLRDIIAIHIGRTTEKVDTIIFLCSVLGCRRKWRNITVHLYVWTVYNII